MRLLLCFLLSSLAAGWSRAELMRAGRTSVFNISLPASTEQTHQAAVRLVTKLGGRTASQGVVFFSTVFQDNLNTWQIHLAGGEQNVEAATTLCFDPFNPVQLFPEYISVVAFSQLSQDQNVDIYAEWETRFLLAPDSRSHQLTVSDDSPQVVQFSNISPQSDYLLVVESQNPSSDKKCIYVGINPPGCPWNDDLSSVTTSRLWSRMLNIGYFPIKSGDFPNSFTVSLITLRNSSECYSDNISTEDEKSYKSVKISLQKLKSDYLMPILVSKLGIVLSSLLFFGVWIFLWYSQLKYNQKIIENKTWSSTTDGSLLEIDTARTPENFARKFFSFCYWLNVSSALRWHLCKELDKSHDGRSPSMKNKSKHVVNRLLRDGPTVADITNMIRDDDYYRRQRSKIFLYLVPLLALFYLVPSVQMVLAEQKRARITGNMEMCYLNYGCSRQWGIFDDFNHIISNGGYIIYGLVFIVLVRLKAHFLPEENRTDTDHLGRIGLPQQHSIFYTLGICMVLQGIFSAIFHTCPSNISLQFDTTMMYVMLILTFIKIYQFRHPDISFNAYNCMYAFVVILILEAISIYLTTFLDKMIFYGVFALLYCCSISYLLIDTYYYGALQTSFLPNLYIILKKSVMNRNVLYPKRLFASTMFALLNLCLLIIFLKRSLEDGAKGLSTPILVILASNVGLFLTYYMVRKIVEIYHANDGEGTQCRRMLMRLFSFLFFLFALLLGLFAAYFYTQRQQSRNKTPPESRNLNGICQYMDFFDNHDLWHFLSATALFLANIFLLTIDDDLLHIDRNKIKVF